MVDGERLVRMIVRKFDNVGVAEDDLFQEGMLALLKAERTFNDQLGFKFETYASRVIHNRLIDVLRTAQVHTEDEPLAGEAVGGKPLTEEIDLMHKREILQAVLATCSEIERAIFNAYFQGYAYDEISGIFGVNAKKIDNTIQKIKKRVQSYNED